VRALSVELVLEELAQALNVVAQTFLLVMTELSSPGRLGALDLVDERVDPRRQVRGRRRRARVEIQVEADRAAVLRPESREIAEAVPRHLRSHGKSLRRKAAILVIRPPPRPPLPWVARRLPEEASTGPRRLILRRHK